jgi:hypothetical protein
MDGCSREGREVRGRKTGMSVKCEGRRSLGGDKRWQQNMVWGKWIKKTWQATMHVYELSRCT